MVAFFDYLPRGSTLSDSEWRVRHTFLQWVVLAHLPALFLFGLWRGYGLDSSLEAVAAPAAFLALSRVMRSRRIAGLALTAGLSTCSVALVVLSGGSIESHFHFFATIGFIALYQDWVPFVWNAGFTTFSHGIGSWLLPNAFFAHQSGQDNPWTWAVIHGLSVLAACVGVMLLLRFTEDDHQRATRLHGELLDSNRKRFTADLLVNLARRNQNLIYRQLELLNRLEDHERDAEQLSHLFQLDHLATRIRRNAESLLVLSGEEPARKWGGSVLLVDVVRAAIAEIEELDRVDFSVDESLQVSGRAVADTTHLLAELIENAVHFSPPGLSVMIRTRPYLPSPGAQVLTIEDWGVGMSPTELADANDLLRRPRDVDLATSQRLGLHVVARLAARYGIVGSLESTPGGGVTAVVVLPAELFHDAAEARTPVAVGATAWPGRPGADTTDAPARTGRNGSANGAGLTGSARNGSGRTGSPPNGSTLNGAGHNGSGLNGSGLNGSGSNGSGSNGSGSNGSGLNGSGLNGSGHNGSGLNGSGANGSGPNGSGRGSGLTGSVPDGSGLTGSGLTGSGLTGSGLDAGSRPGLGTERTGSDGPGSGPAGAEADRGDLGGLSGLASFGRDAGGLDGAGSSGGGLGLAEPPRPVRGLGERGAPPVVDRPGFGALPAPRPDRPGDGTDSWSSWWPLPAEEAGVPTQGVPEESGGLTRRTPQANLADELRRGESTTTPAPVRHRRDPAETRSALSRFQATQRAARQGARRDRRTGEEGRA